MYLVTYLENGREVQTEALGNETEIRNRFAREGKILLTVKKPSPWRLVRTIRPEEIVAVFTALADILYSGENLTKALDGVIPSLNKKSRLVGIMVHIKDLVSQGRPLSQGLQEYREVFGPTVVAMVIAGENSGKLKETLKTVAEHVRKMMEMKREMVRRLIYPAILFVFGISSLFVNSKFTMPALLKNVKDKDADIYIMAMKWLSRVMPPAIILGIVVLIAGVVLFKLHQEKVEKYIIRVPVLRDFIFYRAYFTAFSSLGNLLSVKVPLAMALKIVAQSCHFITVRSQFERSIQRVVDGEGYLGITEELTALDSVEQTMLKATKTVERAGLNFDAIANRYYEQYMARMKSLGPVIYACVMIMIAGVVLLMAGGIMMPYLKMMSHPTGAN